MTPQPISCCRRSSLTSGVRPRPSLRAAYPDRGRDGRVRALPGLGPCPRCAHLKVIVLPPGSKGRCRGSAPALVARGRSCAAGHPWPPRCCRGWVPVLVARTPWTTGPRSRRSGVAGARPRPSLRDAVRAARHRAGGRGVAGVRPRPSLRAGVHAEAGEYLGDVAGVRPRPSLRVARRGQDDRWLPEGVAEAPAPALVARPSRRPSRPARAKRCRGSAPALVARSSRRPGPRLTTRRCRGSAPALVARAARSRNRRRSASGVAGGSAPALVARGTSSGSGRRPLRPLPGFVPGPR